MKTLTTSAGRTLRVSANKSKRTFTIRTEVSKFRTYPMPRAEFENCLYYYTANDWNYFLKSNEYYVVK